MNPGAWAKLERREPAYPFTRLPNTTASKNDAAPMLSGVVLARPPKGSVEDGILTARELFNMNLSAEMIVFSACPDSSSVRKMRPTARSTSAQSPA